jgi:hypothetical protein
VLLKQRFGEFTAVPDLDDPGPIQVDPAWVQEHVESQDLPIVGALTCHTQALAAIRRAMRSLVASGDEGTVSDVGDCYEAVIDPEDPNGPLTSRAFGASLSLNVASNGDGDQPDQDEELVDAMAKAGFGWAGTDAFPQGSLFRYTRLPQKQG